MLSDRQPTRTKEEFEEVLQYLLAYPKGVRAYLHTWGAPAQPVAGAEARLRDVAEAYMQWEAALILDKAAWGPDGMREFPQITKPLWDRLLEIQAMRNAALSVTAPPPPPADLKAEAESIALAVRGDFWLWEQDDEGRHNGDIGIGIIHEALTAAHAAGKAEGEAEIKRWNADSRRLSGCLIAIHQAPDTATIGALKSVAYDAALNCIPSDVAEFQIERRSADEIKRRNEQAEREADAREG